jgi:hypothetical protein
MKNVNAMQRIFIWLAGYDSNTANNCTSSEIRKITIMGTMVLLPGLIGLFSYGYGFYFIFKNLQSAIIGGMLSSIVLILIDRGIMAYGRPGHFSFGMFGRVCLAVTVGILLAEPLILKIFEDSIEEQQYVELKHQKEAISIPYQSQIKALNADLKIDEGRINALQTAYTGEADGTLGTGNRNQGPIYEMKKQDYLKAKADYDAKAIKYASNINHINADKDAENNMLEQKKADGLIGRMRALSVLGEKEPIVKWATWLLRFFFCMVELLPLLIKISPTGDRGLYHGLVDIADKEREEVYTMSSDERKAVHQQEEKLRYTQVYADLCLKETQIISTSKEKDTVYLMDRATALTEKKLDIITRATKSIKDPVLLQTVINHLNDIHNGFMSTIEHLLSKSNKNFGANNI